VDLGSRKTFELDVIERKLRSQGDLFEAK